KIELQKDSMPELPESHRERLMTQYGISPQNAETLTENKALAEFFEECAKNYDRPDLLSNWLVGDLLSYLYEMDLELKESKIAPETMVKMLKLIDDGTISGKIAKEILKKMLVTGKSPKEIVEEEEMRKISDREYLQQLTERVFASNPKAVEDALKDEKAIRFLVGQLMKETKGKADPQLANSLVLERLKAVQAKA
ncbi:MAG: Asp-tRNA(Asn)/Glu-tRNA(Gln) amidotransferase GatCAB subunit B, partial [Candidatus Bathyarchaeota archaeon]|nr:Asp-tRNA(Asn)/Glu-tRNA(Gln) amidotransferase GatCAB subunit B [Candidatus Bathyarchaeota archaeon]